MLMGYQKYKGERMLFIRHVELHHIQKLLMARGKKYDWMIIHIMSEQIGVKFNARDTPTTKERVVDLKIRELHHILHLLYMNKSQYNMKILHKIEEDTYIPYIVDRGCFCDY